jgi:hypothetical protein
MLINRKLRAAALVCALGLLSALPAAAGPVAPRTVTVEYSGPNSFADPEGSAYASYGIFGEAKPRPGERFIRVEVTDESGRPVLAEVHQANRELGGSFCGATPNRLRLPTRRSVHVHLYLGPGCDDISAPTQGSITFTFER